MHPSLRDRMLSSPHTFAAERQVLREECSRKSAQCVLIGNLDSRLRHAGMTWGLLGALRRRGLTSVPIFLEPLEMLDHRRFLPWIA